MTNAESASGADRIIDLYRRHAEDWASRRTHLGAPEQRHLVRFIAHVPPGGHILDLGCGSGAPIATWLSAQGFVVTGVDASPELIERLRAHLPDIETVVADMRGLDLGRTFDGVLAWYSSFHLTAEDQDGMFDVYARHTRPGGAVMFVGGPKHGVAMGEWMGEPLYHASLDPAAYRAGLEGAGFIDIEEAVLDPDNDEGARVWLARRAVSG